MAKLLGELRRAVGGGVQRLIDQRFEAAGLEGVDRRLGGALGRGHPAAQFGRIDVAFQRHARGAQRGLAGQQAGGGGVEAETLPGGAHRLHQQEEVGRAAAGHGGHRVDLCLLVQPQGQADRAEQLAGLLALRGAGTRVGVQAAGTLAQQRRRVGHAAHDGLLAQPALQAGAGDAGGDGDDQRVLRQRRGQGQADVLHHLRLDREDHNVGAGRGGVVFQHGDAVLGGDALALLGVGFAGDDAGGGDAAGQQAADQAGGHVAGADEGDARMGHGRFLVCAVRAGVQAPGVVWLGGG